MQKSGIIIRIITIFQCNIFNRTNMLGERKYAIFQPLVDFRFIGIDILNYFDTYYY